MEITTEIEREEIVKDFIHNDIFLNQTGIVCEIINRGIIPFNSPEIFNLRYKTEEEAKSHGFKSLKKMQASRKDYKKVFEWWAVSRDLADKIQEQEGIVINSLHYGVWWGQEERGCFLRIDSMLNKVADKLMEEGKS